MAIEGWFALLAGAAWFWVGSRLGLVGLLSCAAPGAYLIFAAYTSLSQSHQRRPREAVAFGGTASALAAPFVAVCVGPSSGLVVLALSLAAVYLAGRGALDSERTRGGVGLAARTALDEAMLGLMHHTTPVPRPDELATIAHEVREAAELFATRGWLDAPTAYLQSPPPLERVQLSPLQALGWAGEHVAFDSEYEPHADEPGRSRWLDYRDTRRGHAWLLRHAGGARPWLICLPTYRMGSPRLDWRLFRPAFLHEELGFDLLCPVLALHGPRKVGARSGARFLDGRILDTLHAVAQSIWDVRRLIGWARAQGATSVGVYGVSLGGYHAALLASLEPQLSGALVGTPLVEITRLLWRHGPPSSLARSAELGAPRELVSRLTSAISPLATPAKIPHQRLAIYGATGDRIATPDHARDLWEHWQRPRICWLDAGHLTAARDPERSRFERAALAEFS